VRILTKVHALRELNIAQNQFGILNSKDHSTTKKGFLTRTSKRIVFRREKAMLLMDIRLLDESTMMSSTALPFPYATFL
jgi:hypothetical protein